MSYLISLHHLLFKNMSHHGSFQGFHGRELCGANKWVGIGYGLDLCVGLLYEHRFAVLIKKDKQQDHPDNGLKSKLLLARIF